MGNEESASGSIKRKKEVGFAIGWQRAMIFW
jgi:hypothetical protein